MFGSIGMLLLRFTNHTWATYSSCHRRRINTEEKAKVVVSVCVEEFIQFIAALAVLFIGRFWRILKDEVLLLSNLPGSIPSFLSNHPGAIHPIIQNCPRKNSWRSKELNKFFPLTPNRTDDLLHFLLPLSCFYDSCFRFRVLIFVSLQVLRNVCRTPLTVWAIFTKISHQFPNFTELQWI